MNGAIGVGEEEPVRESPGFANVDIIEAVAIGIAESHAVPTGDSNSVAAFNSSGPVFGTSEELFLVDWGVLKNGFGAINKKTFGYRFLKLRDLNRLQERRLGRVGPLPRATPTCLAGQGVTAAFLRAGNLHESLTFGSAVFELDGEDFKFAPEIGMRFERLQKFGKCLWQGDRGLRIVLP